MEHEDNPYHPSPLLLGPVDEQSEWAHVRRAYGRWQWGTLLLSCCLAYETGLLGLILGAALMLIWQELPCGRFRRFAISAIEGRRADVTLAGLPFVGVAGLPTRKRVGQGSDYVGFLRVGEELELYLQDRDRVIAKSAIRAVKQVKVKGELMGFGLRAVEITFVEPHGGVRQIVLLGKATTVWGMKRSSEALFRQLKVLVPEKMFSLPKKADADNS